MKKLRVLLTFGTRPEAIKMAPVVQACRERSDEIETIVCITGQHRQMLDQVTDYFEIKADIDLNLMKPNQTLAQVAAGAITGLDAAIAEHQPDCVVAQGDTTTVMAASVAAFFRQTPFVHVEAGLRTHDLYAPWPEEFNRRVASIATSVHCAPTRESADNLLAEGYPAHQVHVTGNTVIDALLQTIEKERSRSGQWQRKYPMLGDRRLVLVTGHRRESFGEGLDSICNALATAAERFPETVFLYPVHLNPNVRGPVQARLNGIENVVLTEPATYPEFVWLMDRSTLIVTDSGGVQEEAPALNKPVLVTRTITERPEAVTAGAVELVGNDPAKILERISVLLTDAQEYRSRQLGISPYGDGKSAARIIDLMLSRAWEAKREDVRRAPPLKVAA